MPLLPPPTTITLLPARAAPGAGSRASASARRRTRPGTAARASAGPSGARCRRSRRHSGASPRRPRPSPEIVTSNPPASTGSHVLDPGVEGDRPAEAEVVDVAVEVVADVARAAGSRRYRSGSPRTTSAGPRCSSPASCRRRRGRSGSRIVHSPPISGPASKQSNGIRASYSAFAAAIAARPGADHARPRQRRIGLDRALGPPRRRLASDQIAHSGQPNGGEPVARRRRAG